MCDEDMPAVFQYFTKVSSLPSLPVLPSFSLVLLPLFDASVCPQEALCDEDAGGLDPKDPNRPRFTLQELRDVLHERNELKAKVFLLQEELAYYKRCSQTSELTRFISKSLKNNDGLFLQRGNRGRDGHSQSFSFTGPEDSLSFCSSARVGNQTPVCRTRTLPPPPPPPPSHLQSSCRHFEIQITVTQITLHALSDYNEPCMLKHLHITLQDTCKLNLCSSLSDNILLPLRVHT